MAALEFWIPKRPSRYSRRQRWPGNLGIQLLNGLLLRLLFPAAAVGFALVFAERGVGIFQSWNGPYWLEFALSLVVLDFSIYLQHVVVHRVPLLWRLHRVHHSDIQLDVTSALRFHPAEILLSLLWKALVLRCLGAPAEAVLIFEVLLNAMALFNHANIQIPETGDRILRCFVVTPDMHRIHHSIEAREMNSNFGFNISLWDRIFGTYTAEPEAGQLGMQIGMPTFREQRDSRLDQLLIQPLRRG